MRHVVLDTETTGLETADGHRVIEVGCVEILDREITDNHFHRYINPDREIDEGALQVHGITLEFLADKPRFADIVTELVDYLRGAELVIHNAPFDVGFLNHELALLEPGEVPRRVEDFASVTDSLMLAREKHPGQKNSLDALCRRYEVDNSGRQLHGALLDAQLLAEVFLGMTGGQTDLGLSVRDGSRRADLAIDESQPLASVPVIAAGDAELAAHQQLLDGIEKDSKQMSLWRQVLGEQ